MNRRKRVVSYAVVDERGWLSWANVLVLVLFVGPVLLWQRVTRMRP